MCPDIFVLEFTRAGRESDSADKGSEMTVDELRRVSENPTARMLPPSGRGFVIATQQALLSSDEEAFIRRA